MEPDFALLGFSAAATLLVSSEHPNQTMGGKLVVFAAIVVLCSVLKLALTH